MRLFGFDLSLKVERLKFIIIFSGFLLFLTIGTGVGYKITSSSEFCSKCHAMTPEYATWQVSSHSQISCTDCHIEPGFENVIKQKASGLKHLYSQVTGSYYLPIRQVIPIDSVVCLKCHNLERDFTPSGDLIIPHEIHAKEKIGCVRCHSGVAHGNIATRRATISTSLSEWDTFKAKQEMVIDNTRTPMDDCMKCHQRREGPLECSACHSTSKEPLSHKKPQFTETHGKQALTELDTCNLCHGYSGYVGGKSKTDEKGQGGYKAYQPKGDSGSGDRLVSTKLLIPSKERSPQEIVKYSRENSFCLDCHSKRPESHGPAFAGNHGVKAKVNSDSCFACHSNRSEEKNPIRAVTCSDCHPSTHNKRDWRSGHPIEVKGKVNESCISCHSVKTCGNCHTSLKPKVDEKEKEKTENLNIFDME